MNSTHRQRQMPSPANEINLTKSSRHGTPAQNAKQSPLGSDATPARTGKRSFDTREHVLSEYLAGKNTTATIAKRYGISTSLVSVRARAAKVPMRGKGRSALSEPTENQKLILRMIGIMPLRELANAVNLSHQRVHYLGKRWPAYVRAKGYLPTPQAPRVTKIQRPRRAPKSHVVSFRLDDGQLAALTALTGDGATNQGAREIVLAVVGSPASFPRKAA